MNCDLPGSVVHGGEISNFLNFPPWWKYLEGKFVENHIGGGSSCVPNVTGIQDAGLIGLAILDILIRLVALLAVGYLIYGGIRMVMSQGNGEALAAARGTMVNALVGMLIAILASSLITLVGSVLT